MTTSESINNAIENLLYDSRAFCIELAVKEVNRDNTLLMPLLNYALCGKPPHANRAARVIAYIGNQDANHSEKIARIIIKSLPTISNESVCGSMLKYLINVEIWHRVKDPKLNKYIGGLVTFCFELLNKITIRKAAKVYAIEILYNLALLNKPLMNELQLILESSIEYESPAFRAKSKIVFKGKK